jgi:hypothetical protein
MRKAIVALFAVASAVLAALNCTLPGLSVDEEYRFGPAQLLPASIAVVLVQGEHGGIFMGTAALVDASRGLYLTAAHVMHGGALAVVRVPSGTVQVIHSWVSSPADLAVFQVADVRRTRNMKAFPLAEGPPRTDQILVVAGYHPVRRPYLGGLLDFYSFKCQVKVLKAETDSCVDPGTCALRDRILFIESSGTPLTDEERRVIYPHGIYALHIDRSALGMVHGLSGSPALDTDGAIAGVVSAYYGFDPTGKHAAFASGYVARTLLEQAQKAIDSKTVQQ